MSLNKRILEIGKLAINARNRWIRAEQASDADGAELAWRKSSEAERALAEAIDDLFLSGKKGGRSEPERENH